MISRLASWYGGCRLSCTAGRPKILVAGSVTCLTSSTTRRAQDAITEIHYFVSSPRNYQWVLECDIKACFDEISHTALMDRLRARIKDKSVCALVKAFLKSGVFTELGDREETLTGTPPGG